MAAEQDPMEHWQLRDTGKTQKQWQLNENEQAASDEWQLQEDPKGVMPWQPIDYDRAGRGRNWFLPTLVIVALVAATGYIGWLGYNRVTTGSFSFLGFPSAATTDVSEPDIVQEVGEPVIVVEPEIGEATTEVPEVIEPDVSRPAAESEGVEPSAVVAPEGQTEPEVGQGVAGNQNDAGEPTILRPTPVPSDSTAGAGNDGAGDAPTLVTQTIATANNQYGVNARNAPTTDGSEIVRLLDEGETGVVVDDSEEGWLQIQLDDGELVWVSVDFVDVSTELVEASQAAPGASSVGTVSSPTQIVNATITSPAGLNARVAPADDADVVEILPFESSYPAIGQSDDGVWVMLELDTGQLVWVSSEFAELDGTLPTPVQSAPAADTTEEPAEIAEEVAAEEVAEEVAAEEVAEEVAAEEVAAEEEAATEEAATEEAATEEAADSAFILVPTPIPSSDNAGDDTQAEEAATDEAATDEAATEEAATEEAATDDAASADPDDIQVITTGLDAPEPFTNVISPDSPTVIVDTFGGVNARATPELEGEVLLIVPEGAALETVGRNESSDWVRVVLPDGTTGWLFASLVSLTVDIEELPVSDPNEPVETTATDDSSAAQEAGSGDAGTADATDAEATEGEAQTADAETGDAETADAETTDTEIADADTAVEEATTDTADATAESTTDTTDATETTATDDAASENAATGDTASEEASTVDNTDSNTTQETTDTGTTAETVTGTATASNLLAIYPSPSNQQQHLAIVLSGKKLPILGRTADSEWIQIRWEGDGLPAWVFATGVTIDVDVDNLPVVEP
ncbi:MAG: SH3 domain-containing protein [Chloroflexota bacterium]